MGSQSGGNEALQIVFILGFQWSTDRDEGPKGSGGNEALQIVFILRFQWSIDRDEDPKDKEGPTGSSVIHPSP